MILTQMNEGRWMEGREARRAMAIIEKGSGQNGVLTYCRVRLMDGWKEEGWKEGGTEG